MASYFTSSAMAGTRSSSRRRVARQCGRGALAAINPNIVQQSDLKSTVLPQKRQRSGDDAHDGGRKKPRVSFTGAVIDDLTKMSLSCEQHINLDTEDPKEPSSVYRAEIFAHLFEREEEMFKFIRPDCLTTVQTEISGNMRAILMDWMVEVLHEFSLSRESLFLAKAIVDRALSVRRFDRRELQLVGISALLIAAKMEEVYPPQVSEFVYICDNTYSREQLLNMERTLLLLLNFDVSIPTEISFESRLFEAACVDFGHEREEKKELFKHMVSYLTDLTILGENFLIYKPSTIVQAVVIFAQKSLGFTSKIEMTPTLRYYSQVALSDPSLKNCIQLVSLLYTQSATTSLRAIPDRYATVEFSRISERPNPMNNGAGSVRFPSDEAYSFQS